MKIIVIGAGSSGITAAINYKRNHHNDDVLVIEQLDKPLKKILATGNGKCNLGNSNINYSKYSNPEFAKEVIEGYDYNAFFDSISIKTKLIDVLAYPVSESAVSVREALLNECKKLGIQINIEEKLIDYKVSNQIEIITSKTQYICDKLVLSGGLMSSPKLGSDGSVFEILKSHGYEFKQPQPGLSPLYTKEKTKTIDGIRCKALVKAYQNNKIINEELGEVLFKEHGLSGIVIFNTMSLIARNIDAKTTIKLDLLPDFTLDYLKEFCSSHNYDEFLQAFINPKLGLYLKEQFKTKEELLNNVKNLEFSFNKSYGFDFSQVSVGGIKIDQIDKNLMSKREKNVYIIGELLDIDGPCGGYNLTWAFASAMKIK